MPAHMEPNPMDNDKATITHSGLQTFDQVPTHQKAKSVCHDDGYLSPLPTRVTTGSDGDSTNQTDAPQVHPSSAQSTTKQEPVLTYRPPTPYPQCLRNEIMEEQYTKFVKLFKQLHINILFLEALTSTLKYAKFLKVVVSNKKKLEELATVTLSKECSKLLQNKPPDVPSKSNDPGSFQIPSCIGGLFTRNALIDLCASINLMPYTVHKMLGLDEPSPTHVCIQLADRSVKCL